MKVANVPPVERPLEDRPQLPDMHRPAKRSSPDVLQRHPFETHHQDQWTLAEPDDCSQAQCCQWDQTAASSQCPSVAEFPAGHSGGLSQTARRFNPRRGFYLRRMLGRRRRSRGPDSLDPGCDVLTSELVSHRECTLTLLERSDRLFVNDDPAAVLREGVVLHQTAPF